jgi:hypothetical protein
MIKLRTICLAAAVIGGSPAIASAQGGMTDRNGDSVGSQHIGNSGGIAGTGAMQRPSGTVGSSNTIRSERDAPNGSAGTPPKAKAGPQGDPSKDEDAPK